MCGGIFHHVDTPGSIIHPVNWRLKLKAFLRNSVQGGKRPNQRAGKRGNQVWDPLHLAHCQLVPGTGMVLGPSSFVLLGHQSPRQPTYRCPLTKPTARPGLRIPGAAPCLSAPAGSPACAQRPGAFTPLGLQGPLPSADPGLSLLPGERGFSLPASGMGLPGWQEQAHPLQGALMPSQEGSPKQATGAPSGCLPEAALVPGPQRWLSSGGSITSHSASLPKSGFLVLSAIPSRPSQLSGHVQAQTGPEPTETRLAVVSLPVGSCSRPQAACRREAEVRSCPHHLLGC